MSGTSGVLYTSHGRRLLQGQGFSHLPLSGAGASYLGSPSAPVMNARKPSAGRRLRNRAKHEWSRGRQRMGRHQTSSRSWRGYSDAAQPGSEVGLPGDPGLPVRHTAGDVSAVATARPMTCGVDRMARWQSRRRNGDYRSTARRPFGQRLRGPRHRESAGVMTPACARLHLFVQVSPRRRKKAENPQNTVSSAIQRAGENWCFTIMSPLLSPLSYGPKSLSCNTLRLLSRVPIWVLDSTCDT